MAMQELFGDRNNPVGGRMLKFMERIKAIDRRILAALASIPAFFCLCCCGVFFLTPANTELTADVAQNTAAGRSVVVEEFIVTAESTNTAVTVEISSDTPNPTNTSRPSNTVGLTEIPQPTAILWFFLAPTQGWFSSEHIESVVY
jgi:hypothetical protein